jgi:hypothetical protein
LSSTFRTSAGMFLSFSPERSSSTTSLKPPAYLMRSLIYLMMLPLIVKTNYKSRYIISHIYISIAAIWYPLQQSVFGCRTVGVADLLGAYLILAVLGQQSSIIYLFVIAVMFSSFLPRTYSLTSRIAQTFAKFDRAKAHVNGSSAPIQSAPSDTSITERPPSLPPSPNIWPPRTGASTSSTPRSTRHPRKRREVSRSTRQLSSTRHKPVTTRTWIVRATSTTLKT